MNPDDGVVASQIGRVPRGPWRVVARCGDGAPTVIAVAPVVEGGSPFPTTFWLTCPRLVAAAGELESAGAGARFFQTAAADAVFAARMRAADAAYRQARLLEGGGMDACAGVGVAGQADPLAVKCLHARLAAFLAGIPDPVGEAVAAEVRGAVASPCGEERCAAHVVPGC